ncbi:hypothetical protein RGU11_17405 [Rossellomorea marisflavi]|uniref:hypothetical protein n=1 Tax=Rossellomorea marisflavi TaxID=189381 RepID=UPI0028535BEA|nr:hypothetical protein [Rossellomorea marisflavi]MDR4938160.1 hypothetical protein [Rossellomorea marisflavi]
MISRKIMSACISASLFAIVLALINPNPFGEAITSVWDYIFSATLATPAYLLYSFPVILVYGVLTSVISDKLASVIGSKIHRYETALSCGFHMLFGLVLLPYSLGAALLFFITDRRLQATNHIGKPIDALKSLILPPALYVICMGVIYIQQLFI